MPSIDDIRPGIANREHGSRPRARWPWLTLARAARKRRSTMLAYHGVELLDPIDDPELLCIDPESFRVQLRLLLDAGYEFVRVDEFVKRSAASGRSSGLIAVTFDDGLANLRSIALPILREYGIPATVYVSTGLIGKAYPWTGPEAGLKLMDEVDLRELASAGFEIGAHGVNHLDLAKLSYEECMREMVDSRETLESLIDAEVSTFAYPYASFSPDATRAAKDAGFLAAVSFSFYANGNDRYALSRQVMTLQHGAPSLVLKLFGVYDGMIGSPPGRALSTLTRPLRRSPRQPLLPRG